MKNSEDIENIHARALSCGTALFAADIPVQKDMLYCKVFHSPVAHAAILGISTAAAEAIEGVVKIFTATDILGENQIGHAFLDEPLFPEHEVTYVGQPVAAVLATSAHAAEEACKLIVLSYEPLVPIFGIDAADSAGELYAPERRITKGDARSELARCPHVVTGKISTGAQEHVYLETQYARAVPGEGNEMTIYSSTQAPTEVQEIVARVLGIDQNRITVDVRRLGGGFGGKERAATIWACIAALGCALTKKTVELKLSRDEDLAFTGKRHPFEAQYEIGFDGRGKIAAYSVLLRSNGGAYADLSMAILERAMLHAENCYGIPHVEIRGRALRTNLPPNTAFRGFGAPQGVFAIEEAITAVADYLNKDPLEIRKLNFYESGDFTPYGQPVPECTIAALLSIAESEVDYAHMRDSVRVFNSAHNNKKQGIGVVPIKFGISFTSAFLNQAAALVHVYVDGSVSVSHGGIDMGQGLNTKIAQAAATELGLPISSIKVETTNTKRVANTSPTAASTGADLNGNAVIDACHKIIERLKPVAAKLIAEKSAISPSPSLICFENGFAFDERAPMIKIQFTDVVHAAYMSRIDLCAHGFYATPGIAFDRPSGQGTPFFYFVWGVCFVRAEVDLLTGHVQMKNVIIVHEAGKSLNVTIDRGQVEGAFMQGAGWCTCEQLEWNSDGKYTATSLSTYKVPCIRALPENFRVFIIENEAKFAGLRKSKAIGEPPFLYGEALWFAIRDALATLTPDGFEKCGQSLPHPATPEAVCAFVRANRH